jgi:hypothetical protein
MSLKLNSSGGGSVTLQEPVTASDLTVNLPATLGNTGSSMLVTSDASGNVGLGVTPSAWGSSYKSLDINTRGLGLGGGVDAVAISLNAYQDAGWKYKGTSALKVARYDMYDGGHYWFTAPSGTAGNAISFTQAMTLDANGILGIGATPSPWSSGIGLLDFRNSGGISSDGSFTYLSNNIYFDGANRRKASGHVSLFQVGNAGVPFVWQYAGTGAAGSTISLSEAMRLDSSGGLILAGSTAQKATGTTWSNPSDQRLKDNIRDYNKGATELMQVRVCEWEYNGKGGTVQGTKGLGVVADEIMAVLPDTVSTYDAKLNTDDEEVTAIKKFDATEITWLLVKTVQELKAELDTVKAELAVLKGTA